MARNKVFLYSYHPKSESCRQLRMRCKFLQIKEKNSRFFGTPEKTVINWGSSKPPENIRNSKIINSFEIVGIMANKKTFFDFMTKNISYNLRLVPFTTEFHKALEWFKEGNQVCVRTILKGHSAEGLYIMSPHEIDQWIKAPLYTRYIPKKEEYRVHFAFNEIIDIQRKVLRKTDEEGNPVNPETVDFRIRNLANGFIFQRNNLQIPDDVTNQAIAAAKVSQLDFGAIDIIFNAKNNKAYVLEINTAPGLMNTTLESYANAFLKHLDR